MSYIVPVHPPSSVRHAVKGSFVSANTISLAVAKTNRLELYNYDPSSGLSLVNSVSIHGYIIMLECLPAPSTRGQSTPQPDHIFIGTDRYQYFTCSWDAEKGCIRTEQSYVDQGDRTLRDSRENDRARIDPSQRYMTLELYDGVVSVVPFVQAQPEKGIKRQRRESSAVSAEPPRIGTLGEPVQVRIPEIATRNSCFLDQGSGEARDPRLAILWEDNQNNPYLKVRELKYAQVGDQPSAELVEIADLKNELDLGVSHLIPVPQPYGGILILGERSISYTDSELSTFYHQGLQERATVWSCWTKVDDLRWLLGDDYGNLYFLMLSVVEGEVTRWQLDKLGQASRAACLVYLDEGLVFVGSNSGDSQIVRLREGGLDIVEKFDNVAPILDLQIMDLGRGAEAAAQSGEFSTGQARLVTTSGAWQDGSIRSVRSGVGMEEIGEIGDIELIEDMWPLATEGEQGQHNVLVATFATESRVFKFDADAGVEELLDFCGFELGESTLLAANLPDQKILQVHTTGVKISDLDSSMNISQWKPPDSAAQITSACANGAHIIVVEGGHTLHVFHTSDNLTPSASRTFAADSQVSSVTIPQSQSNICIVAFSQSASLALLDLHSLDTLSTTALGAPGMDIPRSVLIANMTETLPPVIFVSMADGTVMTLSFDTTTLAVSNPSRILLGSEPVFLKALPRLQNDGKRFVNIFASCEQPSLVYNFEGRMIYSAVNTDSAVRVCPFDNVAYPGAIALASPSDLKLAIIDPARTTQIQTLPIGDTVRCLAYQQNLKLFGMGCIQRRMEYDDTDDTPCETLQSFIRLADEVTFKTLDSFALGENELVECIASTSHVPSADLDEDPTNQECLFIVGTSISHITNPGAEDVDSFGRVLVFKASMGKQKLDLCAQVSLKGACRSIALTEDNLIVVGLVKIVALYALIPSSDRSSRYSYRLVRQASYRASTNPVSLHVQPRTVSRPSTIAVGDLMKSLTIIEIHPPTETPSQKYELVERARHFATLWTSAVAATAEHEWAVADMEGNLVILRQNLDGYGDDARRLEVAGEIRLGEVVNKIMPITTSFPSTTSKLTDVTTANDEPESKGKARTTSTASQLAPSTSNLSRQLTNPISDPSFSNAGPLVRPQAFLATVEGSIHMLGAISPAYIDVLIRLQTCLATRVQSPGHMPWTKYRAWKTLVREGDEPFRFVDGAVMEAGLLGLDEATLEDVLREAGLSGSEDDGGMGVSVEMARGWGEELRRLY